MSAHTRTLLALAPLLAPQMSDLEQRYTLLRLYNESDPERALRSASANIVGIISSHATPVRRSLIEALPNLEIIAQYAVGFDNIDLSAATERKIVVTNTPDVLTDDTADIALSLLLALSRRICEADMFVRVGKWGAGAMPLGTSLRGKRVGIVGMGRIGRAIAKRLVGFDMRVLYHARHQKADLSWPFYADLELMAHEADYLVLACAGGPGTHHLVGERVLQALGPKGYLINIARGSVVDEDALVAAMVTGKLAGVGLDVYAHEPNVPDALKSMDNVVLLPHIGSATFETRQTMGELVISNLDAHFAGKPLITPVKLA